MEKSKNSQEINKAVKECFEYNKTADKLFVTSDGQCFLPGAKSAADLHARKNKLEVKEVLRADFEASPKGAPKGSGEAEGYDAKTVKELSAIITEERKLEIPKGAKKDELIEMLKKDDERIAAEEKLAHEANGAKGEEKTEE